MKIKNRYFSIMGLVCLFGMIDFAKAQKTLTIGDVLDKDITGTALNYVKDKLSLSDFKGKAIVIDFWATTCGPCVAELPKLDSLQQVYKDDLQIVPVTYESKAYIENYFKKRKKKALTLPTIVDDRELRAIFKHRMIPHKVWLDRNHKVVAITGSEDFTTANIERFIKNEKFDFKAKIDILDFDKKKPYLIGNNGGVNQRVLYSSIFASRNTGLNSGGDFKKDDSGRIIGFNMRNMDILRMMILAYGKFNFRPTVYNRTILKVKDSSRFMLPGNMKLLNDDWNEKNLYCYDLFLAKPVFNEEAVYKIMQEDIRRAFPYYARVEKQNLECLVLRRTSTKDKIRSKGGKEEVSLIGTAGPYRLININLGTLVKYMNMFPFETPYVVDETGYTGNVDVELGNEWLIREKSLNIESLNKNLKKYDLEFVRKKALVDVLVIYQD